jgi:hypothetical protein
MHTIDASSRGVAVLAEPGVIRLLRFRPAKAAFDAVLRTEIVPAMRQLDGLVDVFAGRQGPGDQGPRLMASVWRSPESMAAALGVAGTDHGGGLEPIDGSSECELLWLPLAFGFRSPTTTAPAVLRFVTGRVRPDELDAYIAEAHEGTIADADAGRGPVALYLAPDPPNAFRTLSVWVDWETLQVATGGDVNRPIATRHAERLVDWQAEHYEILPGLVEPAGASPV